MTVSIPNRLIRHITIYSKTELVCLSVIGGCCRPLM